MDLMKSMRGREDDDFGNRNFKSGGTTKPILFSEPVTHMYHPFDATKKESANDKYYEKRKQIFIILGVEFSLNTWI
jgi:hypothetical protein